MAKTSAAEAVAPATMNFKLSRPGMFLVRMLVFLTLVGFLAAILAEQLKVAFLSNPGLNGLILGVLLLGVLYAFRQVIRLFPEIRWVNGFRIADPGLGASVEPKLLAPMATMLRDRTGALSLSTAAMRSIMDSIGSRLDEARDTGRYLIGLLVFLGLLGTFWGLLETITSVGKAINALDTKGGEGVNLFDDLKAGLAAPLKGMGTAFSSSLLGLSGSLILGFLELQASHAHNRFYNELEEWLSGITELTPGSGGGLSDRLTAQLTLAISEMSRTVAALNARLDGGAGLPGGGAVLQLEQQVADLGQGINQLVTQMRTEQKVVREWADEQAQQNAEVAGMVRTIQVALTPGGLTRPAPGSPGSGGKG